MTKPGQRTMQTPSDDEIAASRAALESLEKKEQAGNGQLPTPKKKRNARPTDPVLLAVARLDRLLADLPPHHAYWAFQYLALRYGKPPEQAP